MPRHVVQIRVPCSDCEHEADCAYVADSGPPQFRFSTSVRCPDCGLAIEADGPELSDDARAAFYASEGRWVGVVRDFADAKTEVLRALRTIRSETPVELMALLREGKPMVEGTLVEVEDANARLQAFGVEMEIRRT